MQSKLDAAVLVVTLLFVVTIPVHAAKYYVSSVSGAASDSNPGTSSDNPWKTLTNVNKIAWTTGTTVYLERGSTFYGTITVNTAASRITFTNYGDASKPLPVISGAVPISQASWSQYQNSDIWQTKFSPAVKVPAKTQVYYQGRMVVPARSKMLVVFGWSGSTITLPYIDDNYSGARVTIRVSSGDYETYMVKKSEKTEVTVDKPLNLKTQVGWGVFFWSTLRILSKSTAPAWIFDPDSNMLYVKNLATSGPPSDTVLLSVLPKAVLVQKATQVVIDGIRFELQAAFAVQLSGTSRVAVLNCEFFGQLGGAIAVTSASESKLVGNKVKNAARGFQLTDVSGTLIRSNRLEDIGQAVKYTLGGLIDGAGITVLSGSENRLEYNILRRIGGFGIRFDGVNGVVDSNVVQGACSQLNDCGGLYSYGTSKAVTISNNLFLNVTSDVVGSGNGAMGHGVYLDNAGGLTTNGFTITGNTVAYAVNRGAFLKGTAGATISNNNFYGNLEYGLHLIAIPGSGGSNHVTGNLFYTRVTDPARRQLKHSLTLQEQSSYTDTGPLATYTSNVYVDPCRQSGGSLFRTSYGKRMVYPRFYTFSQWQGLDRDLDSSLSAVTQTKCYKSFSGRKPLFTDGTITSAAAWKSDKQNLTQGVVRADWAVVDAAQIGAATASARKLCTSASKCFYLKAAEPAICTYENRTRVLRYPTNLELAGWQNWRLTIRYTSPVEYTSLRPLYICVTVSKNGVRTTIWCQDFVISPSIQSREIAFSSLNNGRDQGWLEIDTSCQDPVLISQLQVERISSASLAAEAGVLYTNPTNKPTSIKLPTSDAYIDLRTSTKYCSSVSLKAFGAMVLSKAIDGSSC